MNNEITIPKKVIAKMNQLGITEVPKIKSLVVEYIKESEQENIDWWYFTNWVAMGYSDH